MSNDTFPVTYVLYSHFSEKEAADFTAFQKAKQDGLEGERLDQFMHTLGGIKTLTSYFRGLKELLETPGHEGIVLLFYASGIEELLDNLSKTKAELIRDHPKLQFASRFGATFLAAAKAQQLERRVRMITAVDLHDILGRISPDIAQKAHVNVVGPEAGIRYDVPKIPEAVVRLRSLGHGVPVLRLDQDVLFGNPSERDL